jgi:hypothetical protein
MNANELKINGNTLEDFLQTSREVDEYDNLDCRICAADCIRQLVDFVSQQQAEIEALKAENKFFKNLMGDVEILKKASEK